MSLDSSPESTPALAPEEAFSAQGCGAGTEKACFALGVNIIGAPICLMMLKDQTAASVAGIKLGWRVNADPSDGLAWCPKGVLSSSKQAE